MLPQWRKSKQEIRAYFAENPPKKKGTSIQVTRLTDIVSNTPLETFDDFYFDWSQFMFSHDEQEFKNLQHKLQWSLNHPLQDQPRGEAPMGTSDNWKRPQVLRVSFDLTI